MRAFDPYAVGEKLPAPGRLSVRRDEVTGRHVFLLPTPHRLVKGRTVFLEIRGVGTRTVPASASSTEVSYELPENTKVAAFLVDEDVRGERSRAGPVLHFWTTTEGDADEPDEV